MRMINLFDVDNNELRVGVILLLDGLLSHPDDTSFNASASERAIMKGKMVETLYRCDLVNILKVARCELVFITVFLSSFFKKGLVRDI